MGQKATLFYDPVVLGKETWQVVGRLFQNALLPMSGRFDVNDDAAKAS
jgi:hypothetical protein